MNTTQSPTTTKTSGPRSGSRRRWRYQLGFLAAFALTIALFYAEENWRGRRAWENSKRELEAEGFKLDWGYYIPPPVPEDQNAFGVPEMAKWFEGRGANEFTGKLNYPGWHTNESVRVVVANVTIGLQGSIAPSGSSVLKWADATNAPVPTARLMKEAIGPMGMDPSGYAIMARTPKEVRPAQIFLACETAPSVKELAQILPKHIVPRPEQLIVAGAEVIQVEPAGSNSFRVTMRPPLGAADYVAWGEKVEPDLAFLHLAAQRPYARLEGNYDEYPGLVPNFVNYRAVSLRLAALAESYMLLGQPEKALDELTFLNQVRRTLEFRPSGQRMTLVAAMLDSAITGLYVRSIEDGMRLQAWREPQLAALQAQLKEIQLRPYVAAGISFELTATIHRVEMAPHSWEKARIEPGNKASLFWFPPELPEGWIYQNMVVFANLERKQTECLPPHREDIVPHQIFAELSAIEAAKARWSLFKPLATFAIPNINRTLRTLHQNQTAANQAQIACALERYRVAHGEYPPGLEALMPQFFDKIPPDLIGGQPPRYHRADDGKFLLYSIGWSETDHGGKSGSNGQDGDWVWGDE